MKISELIKNLMEILENQGNIDVIIPITYEDEVMWSDVRRVEYDKSYNSVALND
jgi:hypothetical protein